MRWPASTYVHRNCSKFLTSRQVFFLWNHSLQVFKVSCLDGDGHCSLNSAKFDKQTMNSSEFVRKYSTQLLWVFHTLGSKALPSIVHTRQEQLFPQPYSFKSSVLPEWTFLSAKIKFLALKCNYWSISLLNIWNHRNTKKNIEPNAKKLSGELLFFL